MNDGNSPNDWFGHVIVWIFEALVEWFGSL